MKLSEINPIRLVAWVYAIMFFFIAFMGAIPGLTNASGQLFGLFTLDFYDNALHFASGLWAAIAGWVSTRAAIFYFRVFGILYGLDGIIGLIFGQSYLDGGIFLFGSTPLNFWTRLAANLPHILIGGIAVWVGFGWSRKWTADV
ncbi:MAG: DUF4383 domain-containing protein [Anaerolineae bacterium]|nr:DUF4383 domain-containing protein [Anaerolineae bacterium]GIK41428.1 MAG: hypothetical protein BroJett011_52610 [Chloroflexota bacterium]